MWHTSLLNVTSVWLAVLCSDLWCLGLWATILLNMNLKYDEKTQECQSYCVLTCSVNNKWWKCLLHLLGIGPLCLRTTSLWFFPGNPQTANISQLSVWWCDCCLHCRYTKKYRHAPVRSLCGLLLGAIRLSDLDPQWISVQIHLANRMTLDVSNVSRIHFGFGFIVNPDPDPIIE